MPRSRLASVAIVRTLPGRAERLDQVRRQPCQCQHITGVVQATHIVLVDDGKEPVEVLLLLGSSYRDQLFPGIRYQISELDLPYTTDMAYPGKFVCRDALYKSCRRSYGEKLNRHLDLFRDSERLEANEFSRSES